MKLVNLCRFVGIVAIGFVIVCMSPDLGVRAEDLQSATVQFLDGPVGVRLHGTDPPPLYCSVMCGSTGPAYVEAIVIQNQKINPWFFRFNIMSCGFCAKFHGYITLDNKAEGIAVRGGHEHNLRLGSINFDYRAPNGAIMFAQSLEEDFHREIPLWEHGGDLNGWTRVELDPTAATGKGHKDLRKEIEPGKVVLLVTGGDNVDILQVTFRGEKLPKSEKETSH